VIERERERQERDMRESERLSESCWSLLAASWRLVDVLADVR